jgi:hypothetical protein
MIKNNTLFSLQVMQSAGGLGSLQDQSMWDLWWTKWHWDRFLSEFFGFPLSISFHRRSPTHIIWEMKYTSVSGSISDK